MDTQTINQTFSLVDLIPGLKKAGQYHIGPCPFCGGRDRFTVKHTQSGDRWNCRNCAPDGYRTPIDFLMARDGLSFKEALQQMGGVPQRVKPSPSPEPPRTLTLPSPDWQAAAWKHVDVASDRLLNSPQGQPGRDYLVSRGFHSGTMNAWLLGFAVVYGRPSIVIPWLDMDERSDMIFAVKYRFVDELAQKDKGKRFAMRKGSVPFLFGLQHVLDTDDTLLLVEGEINAMSVWQCLPSRVAVVSIGSESGGRPDLLRALVNCFRRVMIWTDEPTKSRDISARIKRPDAKLLKSPIIDGVKWDANEMLKAGLLAEFLTLKLSTACLGVPVEIAA